MNPSDYSSDDDHRSRRSRRSVWLAPLSALLLLLTPLTSKAQYESDYDYDPNYGTTVKTKISAINGQSIYEDYHTPRQVVPGDVISLSVDQFEVDDFGNATPQNRYVEEFRWSSNAHSNDTCDPDYDCAGSNFEVNDYGVSYYVPTNMAREIILTVENKTDGTYDQIKLVNSRHNSGYRNPDDLYTHPDEYNGNFNVDTALTGHGRWVYIHGERTFVPHSHTAGWKPYQHGYWYWADGYGWVWKSYDPWGWVTDHYGYWRHHRTYGWVWRPFPGKRFRWHAAVVTFFYTDSGIGWYPYYSGYTGGYSHGYNHGYDDGFWDGYRAGLGSRYYWGWSYCDYRYFTSRDLWRYRHRRIGRHYHNSWRNGRVIVRDHRRGGRVIVRDHRRRSRYLRDRAGRRIGRVTNVRTRRVVLRDHRGRKYSHVVPSRRGKMPDRYRDIHRTRKTRYRDRRAGRVRRAPVGSRIGRDGRVHRPGKPVVRAPRQRNRNGGYKPMPPRRRNPGRVKPNPPRRDRGRRVNPNPRRGNGRGVSPNPRRGNRGRKVAPNPRRGNRGSRVAPRRGNGRRVAPSPRRGSGRRVSPSPRRGSRGSRVAPRRGNGRRVAPSPRRGNRGSRVAPRRGNGRRVAPSPRRGSGRRVSPSPRRGSRGSRVAPRRGNGRRVAPSPRRGSGRRVSPSPRRGSRGSRVAPRRGNGRRVAPSPRRGNSRGTRSNRGGRRGRR